MAYNLEELYENKYGRGFDRRDTSSLPDTTFDDTTRIFSLLVKSGSSFFKVLVEGTWYEKTATQALACPDESGTYYWYFDNTGTLQVISNTLFTEELFKKNAICGMVYWNSTTQKAIVVAKDELHGYTTNPDEHMYHHLKDGLVHTRGGLPVGLVDGSPTYTSLGFSVYLDEDIPSIVLDTVSHPFIWREGANGDWVEGISNSNIAHMGASYAYWNEYSGGVWGLTESTSSTDYIIYFWLRTNDRNNPVKKTVGTAAYPSRGAARDALLHELAAIDLAGLPGAETDFAIAYIARRNGDLEDDGNGNAYIKLMGNKNYNIPE